VTATLEPLVEEALLRIPKFQAAAAEEKRQADEQRRTQKQEALKLRKEAEQRIQPVTEHPRNCGQCAISDSEGPGHPTAWDRKTDLMFPSPRWLTTVLH
jgi:hypothetical protein